MNVTDKLCYVRIINNRLKNRADVQLLDKQNGFGKKRFCHDTITLLRQLIEKHRERTVCGRPNSLTKNERQPTIRNLPLKSNMYEL